MEDLEHLESPKLFGFQILSVLLEYEFVEGLCRCPFILQSPHIIIMGSFFCFFAQNISIIIMVSDTIIVSL